MLMYHLLCAAKETINSSLIYHQIFLDYSIEYNMPKICDHTNKNLIQDYCRKSYAFHIIRVVPAINYIVSRELLGNFVNINKFIDQRARDLKGSIETILSSFTVHLSTSPNFFPLLSFNKISTKGIVVTSHTSLISDPTVPVPCDCCYH